jgi:glycosyltransferase involved in cell wall biosynthesis
VTTSTISIITATFNAEKTLSDCIESISRQSVDAEHIIIDGDSTDGTLKIIEHYSTSVAKVVSEPDRGIYDAMNKGIMLATGDVIGILNADDFYNSNDVLKKISDVFLDPNIDACYGDLVYVNNKNKNMITRYWKSGDFKIRKFYLGWMPPHPTFFVRRSVYKKHGLFNLNLGSSADYEIMLRLLLKKQLNVIYIPEVLVNMRTGGESNASFLNRLKANRNDRKAWKVNGLRLYPGTIFLKPLRKIGQWIFKNETTKSSSNY